MTDFNTGPSRRPEPMVEIILGMTKCQVSDLSPGLWPLVGVAGFEPTTSSPRTRLRCIVCCHRLSFRACYLGYDPARCPDLSTAGEVFAASLLPFGRG